LANKDQLLSVLARHIGEQNGATAERLAADLGITERDVRKLVSALREEGIALMAHPARGYFIAATEEEREHYSAFLHARAMHTLRLLAQMRRCSMADLIGQLRLPT